MVWAGIYAALFVFVVGGLVWVDGFDWLVLVIAGPILYHGAKLWYYRSRRERLEPGPASGERLSLALSAPFMVVLPVAFAWLALSQGRGLFRGIGGMLYLAVPILSWIVGLVLGSVGLGIGLAGMTGAKAAAGAPPSTPQPAQTPPGPPPSPPQPPPPAPDSRP